MAENQRSLNIEIDTSDLENLPDDSIKIADMALLYLTEDLLSETVKEAPVDKGTLQTRFDMGKISQMAYFIGSNVFYRWYVHEGTGIYGPHGQPITPVKAAFLQFEIDGQIIRKKEVRGQRPNPYYDRAIETVEDKIGDYIDKAVGDYL